MYFIYPIFTVTWNLYSHHIILCFLLIIYVYVICKFVFKSFSCFLLEWLSFLNSLSYFAAIALEVTQSISILLVITFQFWTCTSVNKVCAHSSCLLASFMVLGMFHFLTPLTLLNPTSLLSSTLFHSLCLFPKICLCFLYSWFLFRFTCMLTNVIAYRYVLHHIHFFWDWLLLEENPLVIRSVRVSEITALCLGLSENILNSFSLLNSVNRCKKLGVIFYQHFEAIIPLPCFLFYYYSISALSLKDDLTGCVKIFSLPSDL